jgi:hypothetical protein
MASRGVAMRLRYLGKTSGSGDKQCPCLYAVTEGGYVVQGNRADAAWLRSDQEAVSVPGDVLDLVPGLSTTRRPALPRIANGEYLVVGDRVRNAEALAELQARGLPPHESAVWVSAEVLHATGSAS